jgi:hypothetical protein
MKVKESIAVKKRIVRMLLKGNDVRPDSPFARYIEHDVDGLYRELDANNDTRRAIERARNVSRARVAAEYIRQALEVIEVAHKSGKSGKSDKMCRAIEHARELWAMAGMYISCSQSPAEVLGLVAKALEGKLRLAAKGDDAILEAYGKAIRAGKRYHERTMWLMPFVSEVYDAFDKGPDVHWWRPTKDVLRRRLRILGLPTSEEPGACRKLKK